MRISDWSSDVCSSDLLAVVVDGVIVDFGEPPRGLDDGRTLYDHSDVEPAVAARRAQIIVGDVEPAGDRYKFVAQDPFLVVADQIGRPPAACEEEIGRESCRERVCQYVLISVVSR